MKAITLRNIPTELASAIEQEAERTGASLNATVIRLLRQAMAPVGSPDGNQSKRHRDLDQFAGTWTKEEADEFDAYLAESRRIDLEMQKLEWEKDDGAS